MTLDIQTWIITAAFLSSGICMGFGAIGAAIGEGYTAAVANAVMLRNPEMKGEIFKVMLVGQAVAESSSIFALVVAIIIMFTKFQAVSVITAGALLGAGLSMGFGAIGSGVGSGFPAASACEGIARQPETVNSVTNVMLIAQAVAQTPAIFSLLISIILIYKQVSVTDSVISASAAMIGAGICMGLGAVGPGFGEGVAGSGAVKWVARNQSYAGELTRTMLIGMAVSESTAIYSLVIALLLIFVV